ncbi:MAG: hypothetical protein PVJ57_14965 [Phycisphaerae bacterium]|jgi:hypothetical protein
MKRAHIAVAFGLLGVALLLVGCDGSGRRDVPAGEPPPATQPAEKPDEAATAEPATTQPATELTPGEAAEPPEPLPDYIRVLERYDASEPARVHYEITSPHRLALETFNVRRLRIERRGLPMATSGSLALRLDGQVIEWTADSTVVEFERSANGVWVGVHE